MQEQKFILNFDRCKGCELCTTACPKGLVKMQSEKLNKEGFITAECVDQNACTACALCAVMCPDSAIEIRK